MNDPAALRHGAAATAPAAAGKCLHIASFVVQHRPEAAAALDAAVGALPGVEVALREGGRSVLLCEAGDERQLLDRVEGLREVTGVIGICLVHHHAEPLESLEEEP